MLNYPIDIPLANYILRATNGGGRIATARDTIPALRETHSLTLQNWFRLEAARFLIRIDESSMHVQPVQARILYGRWLVDCPVCRGANDVIPSEPVYLCSSCGWPERFVMVEFPPEIREIERLLLKRPIQNRNWQPGETLAFLTAENIAYGHEV